MTKQKKIAITVCSGNQILLWEGKEKKKFSSEFVCYLNASDEDPIKTKDQRKIRKRINEKLNELKLELQKIDKIQIKSVVEGGGRT